MAGLKIGLLSLALFTPGLGAAVLNHLWSGELRCLYTPYDPYVLPEMVGRLRQTMRLESGVLTITPSTMDAVEYEISDRRYYQHTQPRRTGVVSEVMLVSNEWDEVRGERTFTSWYIKQRVAGQVSVSEYRFVLDATGNLLKTAMPLDYSHCEFAS